MGPWCLTERVGPEEGPNDMPLSITLASGLYTEPLKVSTLNSAPRRFETRTESNWRTESRHRLSRIDQAMPLKDISKLYKTAGT